LSDQEQDLFRRDKEVLGPSAGGKIKSLLIVKGEVALARAALEQASTKRDPRKYIGAILRREEQGYSALRQ